MAITLDGTNGITTPDVDSDGLTVDTNTLFVDAANNRVGIGTSSPQTNIEVSSSSSSILRLSNLTQSAGGDPVYDFGAVEFFTGDISGIGPRVAAKIAAEADTGSASPGGKLVFYSASINANATERARIDASGNLLVGATTQAGAVGRIRAHTQSGVWGIVVQDPVGNQALVNFLNTTATTVGSITHNSASVAYNTTSDYRLKEDVQPMVGSVDRLMALKPVNFAWKVDGSRVDGFLAHEAQEVVPECVTGSKDAVDDEGNPQYQGIDQSKIVPLLVAALQEALTKIEALEARVAALETNA